jgi:hypothetical protein
MHPSILIDYFCGCFFIFVISKHHVFAPENDFTNNIFSLAELGDGQIAVSTSGTGGGVSIGDEVTGSLKYECVYCPFK